MTDETAPPPAEVIGRIIPTKLPARMLVRNMSGYADVIGAALTIFWPGSPTDTNPRVMTPMVSDEITLEHLLIAREFVNHLIQKNVAFGRVPVPTPEELA